MTDPNVTPTDVDDPVSQDEETIETGAWMDERDAEPSASPEPPEA